MMADETGDDEEDEPSHVKRGECEEWLASAVNQEVDSRDTSKVMHRPVGMNDFCFSKRNRLEVA